MSSESLDKTARDMVPHITQAFAGGTRQFGETTSEEWRTMNDDQRFHAARRFAVKKGEQFASGSGTRAVIHG